MKKNKFNVMGKLFILSILLIGIGNKLYCQNGFSKFFTLPVAGGNSHPWFEPTYSDALPDSGVILSGYYYPKLSCLTSGGHNDGGPFLMRLNKNGDKVFAKHYLSASCGTQFAYEGKNFQLPNGDYFISGDFVANYNSSGNSLHSSYTMRVNKLGNIVFFKYTKPSSGSSVWRGSIITTDSSVVTNSDYSSVPGNPNYSPDFSLFKIDSKGVQKWSKILRGPAGAPSAILQKSSEYINDLTAGENGSVAIVGSLNMYHPENFPLDSFTPDNWEAYTGNALISKIDATGNLLFAKAVHVKSDTLILPFASVEFLEIINTPDKGFLVTGVYEKSASIPLVSRITGMLAKFDSTGNLKWMKLYNNKRPYFGGKPIRPELLTDGYLFTLTNYIPGETIFPGETAISQLVDNDIIIKTDFNGNVVWVKSDNYKKYTKGGDPTPLAKKTTSASLFADVNFKNNSPRVAQAYKYFATNLENSFPLIPPPTQRDSSNALATLSGEVGINVYCADRNSLKSTLIDYDKNCLIDPILEVTNVNLDDLVIYDNVLEENGTLITNSSTYNAFDIPILRSITRKDTIFCNNVTTKVLNFNPTLGGCNGEISYSNYSFGYPYYSWDFGEPSSGSNNYSSELNGTHTYQNNGTYTITLTGYNLDSTIVDTKDTVITVKVKYDQLKITYPSSTICKTGSNPIPDTTGYSGGYFYEAYGNESLVFVDPSSGEIDISSSSFGTYTIVYARGCDIQDTVILNIVDSVNTNFDFNNSYCQSETNPLPIYPNGGTAGIYSAKPTGLVFIDTLTGQINLLSSLPGNYILTNTISGSGCATSISTDNISISSVSKMNNAISICSDSTYTLPSGLVVNTASTYIDTLTSKSGCDSIITTILTVNPIPEVEITENQTINLGSSIILSATGGGTYSWYPSTYLSCFTCDSTLSTPSTSINYCVDIKSTEGCVVSKCVEIVVDTKCGELFVPTSFSPNGDNINDKLEVKISPFCVQEYDLKIFDRWGELIFESVKVTDSWDGKYNGKELDNAVFVYYLKVKLINTNESIVRKGNVSLIR